MLSLSIDLMALEKVGYMECCLLSKDGLAEHGSHGFITGWVFNRKCSMNKGSTLNVLVTKVYESDLNSLFPKDWSSYYTVPDRLLHNFNTV